MLAKLKQAPLLPRDITPKVFANQIRFYSLRYTYGFYLNRIWQDHLLFLISVVGKALFLELREDVSEQAAEWFIAIKSKQTLQFYSKELDRKKSLLSYMLMYELKSFIFLVKYSRRVKNQKSARTISDSEMSLTGINLHELLLTSWDEKLKDNVLWMPV